jgi:hypothetical protein
MTAQEFFYWLQGFIELCNAGAIKFVISTDIARCILAHIDLMPEGERGEAIIEVRTLVRLAERAGSQDRSIGLTRDITDAVAQVFLHVIDPKAGDTKVQAELNAKHNSHLLVGGGNGGPKVGPVIRC